ncbi:hypothetical protein C3F09_03900 [candidate division GN15 bacterium]|uniref:Uncharacterized protein n=1 Tax=candidate division GN15 bacterium TaxID=2072418 RepID=A0A855X9Q1_9BACT|nr:MAG: hypothetical protein C3F09_03900 [candidate division GN15 bacterium]
MRKLGLVLALCGIMASSGVGQERARQITARNGAVAFKKSFLWTFVPVAIGGGIVLKGVQGNSNTGLIVAGTTIGGLGLLVGPSAGHIYAGRPHPVSGMGLRLLIGVVGGAAVLGIAIGESMGGDDFSGTASVAGVSGAAIIGSVVYDIATASRSAERYNQNHGLASWRIQPGYFAQQKALGLRLSVHF